MTPELEKARNDLLIQRGDVLARIRMEEANLERLEGALMMLEAMKKVEVES